jgi:hypothetical protein
MRCNRGTVAKTNCLPADTRHCMTSSSRAELSEPDLVDLRNRQALIKARTAERPKPPRLDRLAASLGIFGLLPLIGMGLRRRLTLAKKPQTLATIPTTKQLPVDH